MRGHFFWVRFNNNNSNPPLLSFFLCSPLFLSSLSLLSSLLSSPPLLLPSSPLPSSPLPPLLSRLFFQANLFCFVSHSFFLALVHLSARQTALLSIISSIYLSCLSVCLSECLSLSDNHSLFTCYFVNIFCFIN